MSISPIVIGLLVLAGSVAGAIGAMVGIGGGILLIPVLVLWFHVPPHEAVASSLVAVVATSAAASSVYVGRGLANMRLAMTLELATTTGAICGGLVATALPDTALLAAFATFTLATAGLMLARPGSAVEPPAARSRPGLPASRLRVGYETPGGLAGGYLDEGTGRVVAYEASRVPVGLSVSFVAGAVSGTLGVGGGFLKVPAMYLGMRVPVKVAAATSNFMIGVTAAASVWIYQARGYLWPLVGGPVALGVTVGALLGTRVAARVPGSVLARVLALVLIGGAVQMALRAFGGGGA